MTGSPARGASLLHQRSIFKVGHSKLVWYVFKPKLSAESGKIVKNTKKSIFHQKNYSFKKKSKKNFFFQNFFFNIFFHVFKPKLSAESGKIVKNTKKSIFHPKMTVSKKSRKKNFFSKFFFQNFFSISFLFCCNFSHFFQKVTPSPIFRPLIIAFLD